MTKEPYGGYRRKTDAQNLADAVELMLPHIRTVADMGAHMRAMAAELHRLDAENESLRAMPAREWQGLSEAERVDMMPNGIPALYDGYLLTYSRAIEAKLKERNHA